MLKRCSWCSLSNPVYIEYHDTEWGVLNLDDKYLFEMLILESFHAGLSWEIVLNKRENFRKAFDDFDINKIINYNSKKIDEILNDSGIIRNKLKINATISNAKIFKDIQAECGSFSGYLTSWTKSKIYFEIGNVRSELSDNISKDLIKRGMKFVGSVIIYAYLQAIGIINSHDKDCYLYKNTKS